MAQIPYYFYVLIIFLSLFIVATNSSSSNIISTDTPCKLPSDCPENMCTAPKVRWCVDRFCSCKLQVLVLPASYPAIAQQICVLLL
ncbi:unnamed protein product [Trifolium pratense]|uniref:Uncharacterized protein n=1 Tax=Trifolium pratense TaxID=57577 RepID=A0ACB0KUT3_TRIPR|nr:unnamed protein product [Trifolium pratense]